MKAITVRHPWAWAIIHMGKVVENRSWSTSYRGPLLIHASGRLTAEEYGDFAEFVAAEIDEYDAMPHPHELAETLGHIIGVVDLVDVVEDHPSPWFVGPRGLVLSNPRRLTPVRLRGQQLIFNVPGEIDGDQFRLYKAA